uniref:Uncharacterized protein n=1 Tax=Trichuris muris TaxID=70415 RepID=A0A5S6Q034_TRIMR
MIKRPNSKETEEDLLLQQKEFLRRRSASHASTTMAGLINLQERLKKLERSGRKMSEKICGSVMSPVVERNYNDVTVKDEVPVELSTCRVNEEKMWNQGSFSGSSKEAKEMKFDGHSTVGASDQQRPANDRHTMFMDILRMKDKLRLNPSHSSKSCDTTKQTPNVAPKTEHENSMAANRFLNDTSISEIKKDFSISRIRQTSTMVYPYQSASEDITSSNVTAFKDNYEFRTRIPSGDM